MRLLPSATGLAYGVDANGDINEAEYKAFSVELGALGLSFDSPELKGMENGDMWRYLIGAHVIGAHADS